MNTRARGWLVQIAAVLLLATVGMASGSGVILGENSCRGQNVEEGVVHGGWVSVSGEACQGCADARPEDAAGLFVAPGRTLLAGQRVVELSTGGNTTTQVVVGGGATTSQISAQRAAAIQAFADRTGSRVTVVGSRASGQISSVSDFDYIIEPINSRIRSQAMRDLPRGPRVEREFGQTSGIDIIRDVPLDPSRPHIIFEPRPSGN